MATLPLDLLPRLNLPKLRPTENPLTTIIILSNANRNRNPAIGNASTTLLGGSRANFPISRRGSVEPEQPNQKIR